MVADPKIALSVADIAELSRLFDEGAALPAAQREAWLARLATDHPRLAPRLRQALDDHQSGEVLGFMSALPVIQEAAPESEVGRMLGPYVLLSELGRGGMGQVWLAERIDGKPRRKVAVKLPTTTLMTPAQIERFERERDVLALLSHPRIAPLFDAGVTPTGQPYLVLELVVGQPITRACDEASMGLRERLRLFLDVLDAVGHAHRNLVVHRDLKPSNVMLDAAGGVKLLDFGVAKLLTDTAAQSHETHLTQEGGRAFTPAYAAPEQILGEPVSTATDVYALGVLLHELLTGRLPHDAAQSHPGQALHAKLNLPPRPPSAAMDDEAHARCRGFAGVTQARGALRGDLDAIVLKALAIDPAGRYRGVEPFAEDVRRFLAHAPVSARRAAHGYRARLFVRRHKGLVMAGAAGLLGMSVFAGLAWLQYGQAREHAEQAMTIRDFMLNLVEASDPTEERAGQDVTGREMIAAGIRRARVDFAGQPRLRGDLLAELARMQDTLGDAEGAQAVVGEALALLEAHAPADDPALSRTRTQRAQFLFADGQQAEAERLAGAALAGCSATTPTCARARTAAGNVLSQLAQARGDLPRAIDLLRRCIVDAEQGFGPRHDETVMVMVNLATLYRGAGNIAEAAKALDQAESRAAGQTRSATLGQEMARVRAALEYELGHFTKAIDAFDALARAAHHDRERAMPLRMIAQAQLAQGRPQAALASAGQALDVAQQAGVPDTERLYALQAHARAQALAGRGELGLREITEVIDGLLRDGHAPASMQVLRARRYRGEILMRLRAFERAESELRSTAFEQQAAGAGHERELTLTLDALGTLMRLQGRAAEAAELHRQAAAGMQRQMPDDHPWRMRNALSAALDADLLSTPGARARAGEMAQHYRALWPADSIWAQELAGCAPAPAGRAGPDTPCGALL